MAAVPPPHDCPSPDGPKLEPLVAGSILWRVHARRRGPTEFRSTGAILKRADPVTNGEEGRFDCRDGEYGYLYAAETRKTALAEAFLRGPAVKDPAARVLSTSRVAGTVLSRVDVKIELPVVDLRGAAGLGRVGQDAWLGACDESDYTITQQWATAIRRWSASAAGLLWMSKRDNLHFAIVLFGDRVPHGAIDGRAVCDLHDPLGLTLLARTLAEFNVVLD